MNTIEAVNRLRSIQDKLLGPEDRHDIDDVINHINALHSKCDRQGDKQWAIQIITRESRLHLFETVEDYRASDSFLEECERATAIRSVVYHHKDKP